MTLRDNIAAGEATHGDFTSHDFGEYWHEAHKAYEGSLNAAKMLHEEMLPDWEWRLRTNRAWVWRGIEVWGGEEIEDADLIGNPARAWLLAILDALIAWRMM